MWLNRSSRIWRSRVQSPAHFWLKQSHLFRGLCPREMASWGQTPFFWSSERMLVCRTIGLSPLLNLIKRMFALRTIEREGGGVRARWQNFRTRIPLLWVRCQLKTFYSGLLLEKKLFQMLLAPLCPRVTRSSARSCGARFSFQLLKSWVQCRLKRTGFDSGYC